MVGVARHSETLEEPVIYYDEKEQLWARPVEMFTEQVELEDGSSCPRFRLIET